MILFLKNRHVIFFFDYAIFHPGIVPIIDVLNIELINVNNSLTELFKKLRGIRD